MCSDQRRGTLPETLENLRQPMPLGQKLALILRNNWIKIRTGSTCCGHHGQPGC
ncbi:MAG: hypothetical protein ACE5H9_00535 [Anaerolineae bacterium]